MSTTRKVVSIALNTFGGSYLKRVEQRYTSVFERKGRSLLLPRALAEALGETDDASFIDADKSFSDNELFDAVNRAVPSPAVTARPKRRGRHHVELYSLAQLEALQATIATHNSSPVSNDRRRKELLDKVKANGTTRDACFPRRAFAALQALRTELPQFADVIDHVELALVVAKHARAAVRVTPILLLGPAGVGKSYFTERLAYALGLPVHRQQMDATSTGFTLAGADPTWSNSNHGSVFGALTLGTQANPIFLLDELDKAGGRTHYDPLAPLHGLLEPVTASHFADAFLPLPIDASRILWIATANQAELLAEPLRSRFREFEIPAPGPVVMARVVQSIFDGVRRDFQLRHKITCLHAEAVDCLAGLTPRAVRLRLERAVGRALASGRSDVQLADVWLPTPDQPSGIGFLAPRGRSGEPPKSPSAPHCGNAASQRVG